MFGFTRQEQKFVLFLLVSFIVGLGIRLVKKSDYQKGGNDWSAEHDSLFAEFKHVTNSAREEESYALNLRNKARSRFQPDKKSIVSQVNINTADIEALQILPGIGPSMAQRIIDYRKSFGLFHSIEDLMKIKGIGPKTFDKLKKAVTVDSKSDGKNLHSN